VIAVKRDPNGQGGSLSMHDEAREGMILPASLPDNAFPLVDTRAGYIFIAGGIGITPILSMIRSFGELPPAPWKLYYFTQ
ncbi:oxidoreductase, partial [Enterobacter asburiae]